jgi:hypothetical protein
MTVQSSFLIRCTLSAPGVPASGRAYYVRHVQSGTEFRSATLEELTRWVAEQNLRYLSGVIDNTSPAASDGTEDFA